MSSKNANIANDEEGGKKSASISTVEIILAHVRLRAAYDHYDHAGMTKWIRSDLIKTLTS